MPDSALHIAIDGRELVGRPTGVGRYLLELLRRWAKHPAHRFTVVVPAEPSAPLRALGDAVSWRVERAEVAGTRWEQFQLPRALRQERPDVLFAPAYTAPLLTPCPFVLVIHDLSYFAHPEWFRWREGLRRRWLTRVAARRASAIVTVSQFSRDEIQRYLGLAGARIAVAPQGPPSVTDGQADGHGRVVLYVGSLFNRRHVPEMIQAFAQVAADVPDARLILVGDNRTMPKLDPRRLAADAGVEARVDWREYVSDAELASLYRSARVFLFLSDYEGYAMTPFEAVAHGVPAVVQDTPVSREVYGDAAIRVPPDPTAVADALKRLLTDDTAHAAALVKGRARLATSSWDTTAQQILRLVEEAAR